MPPLSRRLLSVVVFLTGASVLVLEVLALRVLSPYYGNTIFTVSSVISVVLLGLSCGYYAGGKLCDRNPSLHWFFGIILASGVLQLLLYVLGRLILPVLSDALSIATGPLVSSMLLFLLPALLLGTISPYAVKLQSMYVPDQGVGSAAGTIFFWSTLGSITGSLVAGFVLIPSFGIDRILMATAALLCAMGFVPLVVLSGKRRGLYALLVACALTLGAIVSPRPPTDGRVVYGKDGVYQKITIYDDTYVGRPARILLLDRSESGAMFLDSSDPADLVYDYTKYYSLYKIFTPRVRNALVLGGGAYSIPKALLHELPDALVDVAEIEPSLFDLAKEHFGVVDSPRLRNYVEDGRRFLHDSATQYDLIFGDVYYSYFSVPPQFTTREFFALAKEKLQKDGVFIANMIGDLSRKQPSLIMAEIRTFQTVFPNSYFFAVDAPEKIDLVQNITLVGFNSDKIIDVSRPPVTTHPDPLIRFLRYKVLDVGRRFELSPYPVLTDNFSPVEYLTARVLRRSLGGQTRMDGEEMRALVDQQLRYGPRLTGAPGHAKVQEFLLAEMAGLAQEVKTQTWTQTGLDGTTHELTNIVGRFFASEDRRIVLATHYDGNAPSSGAAVLLESARILINSPAPPRVGVDIVFFDGGGGEDGQRGARPTPLGSTYFARHLDDLYERTRPIAAVVLDTLCSRALTIAKEPSSVRQAPAQVEALWRVGQRIDRRVFQDRLGPEILSDQTPLNQAGIPTVLVIDAEVAPAADTCRAKSLEIVGRAVLDYLNALD